MACNKGPNVILIFRAMTTIIVAVASNGAIGRDNGLLWHIKEDMVHFRTITTGHAIIMGRKTFESIGRPLPKRTNIVITRQQLEIPGCTVVHSLQEAIDAVPQNQTAFIIGGAQIYGQALEIADHISLTEVHRDYEADAFFPPIPPQDWEEVSREDFSSGEDFEDAFSFVELQKKRRP